MLEFFGRLELYGVSTVGLLSPYFFTNSSARFIALLM
jgi:hypothetical protein